MSDRELYPFTPDWTLRPGVLLREELKARGWTAGDLAEESSLLPEVVDEVLAGTRPVDTAAAIGIGRALGTTPEMWLNAQRIYDRDIARGARDMSEDHEND